MTLRMSKVPVMLFAFLLVAMAMVVISNPPQVIKPPHGSYAPRVGVLAFSYGDLGMTNHALDAHKGQDWNAVRITNYFNEGKCKPKIDICSDGKQIHSCELDNLSIGLVIVKRLVITGFAARKGYWGNRCAT